VHLVGQDWGAAIAYGVLAAFPELIRSGVVMAIPHPAKAFEGFLDPRLLQRSFHWWFFQLAELPEMAVAANDYAFIDFLWESWTRPGHRDVEHIAGIKRMLAEPGALGATLAYYRALFDPGKADPALAEVRGRMDHPITVPTMAVCGGLDLREASMSSQAASFAGPYRYEMVPDADHFLHREKPAEVTALLLDWLGGQGS
jgi:pimeloyl-ACP methyl ester carboxylesterase